MNDGHSLGGYNRALCKCGQPGAGWGCSGKESQKRGVRSLGVSLQGGQEGEEAARPGHLHPKSHPRKQPPEGLLVGQEPPCLPPGEHCGHRGPLVTLCDTH